jgi:hypothetical protein
LYLFLAKNFQLKFHFIPSSQQFRMSDSLV